MKTLGSYLAVLTLLTLAAMAGCSAPPAKSSDASGTTVPADISAGIRKSLDEAGLNDVSAMHDGNTGEVTLGGHVGLQGDRTRAETIARSMAGGHMVSNQISVMPMGSGHGGRMGDHGGRMAEPHR